MEKCDKKVWKFILFAYTHKAIKILNIIQVIISPFVRKQEKWTTHTHTKSVPKSKRAEQCVFDWWMNWSALWWWLIWMVYGIPLIKRFVGEQKIANTTNKRPTLYAYAHTKEKHTTFAECRIFTESVGAKLNWHIRRNWNEIWTGMRMCAVTPLSLERCKCVCVCECGSSGVSIVSTGCITSPLNKLYSRWK